MTLSEASQQGIQKLRKPQWVTKAYLQIDLFPNGGHGPWGHLYDKETQQVIGEPTPQHVLVLGDTSDNWEAVQP